MREVEKTYQNMSRERLHGNQRPKPTQADNASTDSDSDDEPEDATQSGTSQAGPVDGGLGGNAGGNESDESDDGDYLPPDTHSSDSEDELVDSDEMDSDDGYDSYGLADP